MEGGSWVGAWVKRGTGMRIGFGERSGRRRVNRNLLGAGQGLARALRPGIGGELLKFIELILVEIPSSRRYGD